MIEILNLVIHTQENYRNLTYITIANLLEYQKANFILAPKIFLLEISN